jgi:hypothetical protein
VIHPKPVFWVVEHCEPQYFISQRIDLLDTYSLGCLQQVQQLFFVCCRILTIELV